MTLPPSYSSSSVCVNSTNGCVCMYKRMVDYVRNVQRESAPNCGFFFFFKRFTTPLSTFYFSPFTLIILFPLILLIWLCRFR